MSIEALGAILDSLNERSSCTGKARVDERIAIALPNGDVGAVDDSTFVDWLLEHAELAPYGDGTATKVDKTVRNAQRLVARDKAEIHGFDPATILGEIEAVLSPGAHLEAKLTDVIVYPKGGKFERHKDTPRAANLVATLVVGLPVAHTGGAFVVDDGRARERHEWSEISKGELPWVALFTDVDHSIEAVKSGSRVTLVYALYRTDKPRTDATWTARQATLQQVCRSLAPPRWPLMIACGRHALAEPGTKQPQSIETLRGLDRDLADVLVEAGYRVGVRACIAPVANYDPAPVAPGAFPRGQNLWGVTRLSEIPPAEVMANMGDEGTAYEIEEYMVDSVAMDQWLVRNNAAATLAHENAEWAEQGNFGNEGYAAILYTLAALEVTKPTGAKKATKKPTKKTAAKKPAAKKPAAKKPAGKKPAAKKPAGKR